MFYSKYEHGKVRSDNGRCTINDKLSSETMLTNFLTPYEITGLQWVDEAVVNGDNSCRGLIIISGIESRRVPCTDHGSLYRSLCIRYFLKSPFISCSRLWGNIKMYLHFLSLLGTRMSSVAVVLPRYPFIRGCWSHGGSRSQCISSHGLGILMICPVASTLEPIRYAVHCRDRSHLRTDDTCRTL